LSHPAVASPLSIVQATTDATTPTKGIAFATVAFEIYETKEWRK
jgi:hypothetical protein